MATYTPHFDSIAALVDAKPSKANALMWSNYIAEESRGADWFGIAGGHSAVAAAINSGWSEGLAKAQDSIAALQLAAPASIKRRRTRADCGDSLDMPRVWSGDLDRAWERCEKSTVTGSRNCRLYAPIAGKWSLTPDQLFWRGAALVIIADSLASAGYAVEIVGASACETIGKNYTGADMVATYIIKPAQAPLDLASLTAVAALSGFLRSCIFRVMTGYSKAIGTHFGRHGEAAIERLLEDHCYQPDREAGLRVFTVPVDLYSKEAAQAAVEAIAAELDCTA